MKQRFNYDDVKKASERISNYVYKTPLEKSCYLSSEEKNVFLKLECLQPVKAFKIRGALNKMLSLSEEEKSKGVITTSSGNHGISVSYGAKLIGIDNAVVIVPKNTPQSKIDKIKYFGGNVMVVGDTYDQAHEYGTEYMKDKGMTFIDGWDDDEFVYAGQGTIALEIVEQCKDVDTILVPVGGGGMCTGVAVAAKALNPKIKVIGLQTEACPALIHSIRDGVLYNQYPNTDSICEALIGGIGHIAYQMHEYVDEILEVKEEYIKRAVSHAVKKEKIVAEPSGAITIGAMLQYGDKIPGKNIALVISGGNVDETLLTNLMNQY